MTPRMQRSTSETALEARLRRRVRHQGCSLARSRRQIWSVDNLGGYRDHDANNWIVAGQRFEMTPDDIKTWLDE